MDAADRIARTIASEINASPAQVAAATGLLDGGATVPFVARYRKEVTGGLDDTQLRNLAERLAYLRELEARRAAILDSVKGQGKLTEDLARAIAGAETKATLEDIYLPYKPKRRTKAMIARENGLEPLLRAIQNDRATQPEALAAAYLGEAVPDTKAALDGARDILVEELSENAALLGRLREFMQAEAVISARVAEGKEQAGAKFSDYFAHSEKWAAIPGHRALAILRGEIQAMQDGVRPLDSKGLASLQSECDRLARLVEDLYQLSVADAGGLEYRFEKIDLAALLREVVEDHAPRLAQVGLTLQLEPPPHAQLPVRGDERRLMQLFANLLTNAQRYTDAPGKVVMRILRAAPGWRVEIDDSPPGVAPEHLPKLFDRLFRVEASRNRAEGGAGLGLSICKSIMEAHGGSIEAAPSPLGGLRIILSFPVTQ